MTGNANKDKTPKRDERPGWKKKRWQVLTVFVLFLFWVYFIPRFPFEPYQLYADLTPQERAAILPFEKLSTQKSYPFYRMKRPGKFQAAVSQFPDARSCLVASEAEKAKPDLRLMDWDKPKSTKGVEVCLWHIFSSLNTPERVQQWMIFHDINARVGKPRKVGLVTSVSVWGLRSYQEHNAIWPTTGFLRFGHLLRFINRGETYGATWREGNLTSSGFNNSNTK
ncbi:MAG: hypothetical protein AAGA53_07015 [Pseudomonadota bacterium]